MNAPCLNFQTPFQDTTDSDIDKATRSINMVDVDVDKEIDINL